MGETCWWPCGAAAGGRHSRLARILFKMLRSSKAEISASCGKEESKFSNVSCKHHLQPLTPLGKLANFKPLLEFSSFEWKQVGSSPHLPFPGAPPIPRLAYPAVRGARGKSSLGRRPSPATCSAQAQNSGPAEIKAKPQFKRSRNCSPGVLTNPLWKQVGDCTDSGMQSCAHT